MKLTKRLLAIVLAAAMLASMVVFSTSAVQLDDAVSSLTWDDCAIDKDTNPYTVKLGFKIYKVDTASGEYTLLADTNAANDTYDVSVEAGDVLRVESWVQTNFHTIGIQLSPVYNNAWLLPTKMSDYSTFTLKAANAGAKVSLEDGMPAVENFDESYGAGDGTFEAPIYSNEALTPLKGQTNHNAYNGIKACLPNDWKGTGTTAANWYSKTAVDEYGNAIAGADGMIYNVYQFGCGNNSSGDEAWTGFATVLNVYQPICAFNLTVAEGATGMSRLFFPASSYKGTTNPSTWVQAFDYDAVIDSPNVNGNWDESMPQVCSSGITSYKNTVKYPDGTETDKNWIVTNATITVGGGAVEPEPETTTEAPTEPPVEYADLAALQAAIAKAATADKTNCTSASVAEFEAALAAANALNVEGTLKSEQDAVDAAATRLENAITGLTKLGACNYAELDAAIAAYEAKAADSYKYANWADYTALYEAAKAVTRDMIADEAGANQKVIDDAAAALNNFALVEKSVDYAAWNAAVAKVPADLSAYTPASVAAYETAKAAAEAAKDAAVAAYDQAALDKAAADLEAAIALLAAKADKAALQAAIARATALDAADYTPDSWAAADLATVLAAANEVNANDNADADAIAAAVAAIEAAEAKLVAKADKGALADAIAAAKALDAAEYTPDSWSLAGLENAIGSAETVYNDGNATADAVAGAIAALEAAAAKLVKLADKAALKAAIDTLPAVTEDKAIAATWEAYEAELAEANAVYADANATQGAVDAAEAELLAAIAGVKALGNCDYTVLDEAIAAYEAKLADKDLYENWAAYEAAYDAAKAIARDMIADEAGANQKAIDDAAAALNAVVLEYKAADYAAVDAALAKVPADLSIYTSASAKAVEDAVAAVVEGYDITKQAEVDAMAAAIEEAVKNLVPLAACDYSELDAALALVPAEAEDAYTELTWKAYAKAKAAAEEIARDLLADEAGANQAKIDAAAQALVDAYNALKINVANVTDVDYDNTGVYAKATLAYQFKVNGAPSKLQIVLAGGSTITIDRRSTKVASIESFNAEGATVDYAEEDPAYEIWTINLALAAGDYSAKAKYGKIWDTEAYAFAVEYDEYSAEAEAFTASVGEYVDATEVVAAKGEMITFKAVTDATVTKIQMVLPGGSTATYTTSKAVDNGDGTLTWTVTRIITLTTEINLKVKTPAGWATDYVGNVKVTIA